LDIRAVPYDGATHHDLAPTQFIPRREGARWSGAARADGVAETLLLPAQSLFRKHSPVKRPALCGGALPQRPGAASTRLYRCRRNRPRSHGMSIALQRTEVNGGLIVLTLEGSPV
jgi:hypothetical protein